MVKKMIKTIRVMLIPNNKQKTKLFRYANTARFAYNWALGRVKENYKNGGKFLSDGDLRKEREIVKMGINTFIYLDDIEEYIDNVAKDTVKIIEIENYEREIPDEIVEVIKATKDKFDQLYIVFTDYTGRIERQVNRERREKDSILFGTFQKESDRTIIDRFYYLGDWQDEYCDLTLDKMVNETKNLKKRNIAKTISTPEDIKELAEQLGRLEEKNATYIQVSNKKKTFFSNIKTVLLGKKR